MSFIGEDRPRSSGILVVAGLTFMSFCNHVGAAEATDYFDLTPEQLLGAKVVSVSKREENVATAPAAVYVITNEDIVRSGVTNIPDALRMAPGVDVAQINSSQWAVSIRGFNANLSNKILVMIDGRTVYNPLFAGTYWEVQDLVLQDIERIEVVRGPGGTLWGANAVDGVINIITKKAKDTQGTLIEAGAGNYENGFATGRYGGAFGRDSYYRVYAKDFSRGSFDQVGSHDSNEDDWQSYRTGFRVDSGEDLTIQGDAYHVSTNELNDNYSLTPPYTTASPQEINSRGANLLAHIKHDYDDGAQLSFQTYLDYTLRDEVLLRDSQIIYDADTQYSFAPIGRHQIIVGGGYRLTADDLGGSTEVTFDPKSRAENLFNIFGQDKISLVPDHWFLTLGSKVEHNDYTGFEFEPDARLEWLPTDSQTVWTSVSRAVREPSRIERDLDVTHIVEPPGVLSALPTEVIEDANKDFQSEVLIAYESGYRQQITRDVSADLSLFANDYTKLATTGFLSPSYINGGADLLFPVDQTNGMTAQTYGGELATGWQVNPVWKLSANYTYLEMFLHVADNGGFHLEGAEHQSPNNQFSLRSNWNISKSWTLDSSLGYVDGLKTFHVPAYTRLDMNLGWQVMQNVHLSLIGQNLLQATHREFDSTTTLNAAEIPRSVFGKVTWQF